MARIELHIYDPEDDNAGEIRAGHLEVSETCGCRECCGYNTRCCYKCRRCMSRNNYRPVPNIVRNSTI